MTKFNFFNNIIHTQELFFLIYKSSMLNVQKIVIQKNRFLVHFEFNLWKYYTLYTGETINYTKLQIRRSYRLNFHESFHTLVCLILYVRREIPYSTKQFKNNLRKIVSQIENGKLISYSSLIFFILNLYQLVYVPMIIFKNLQIEIYTCTKLNSYW